MKPAQIPTILDLAWEARLKGEIFNPMFTGEAGLGKSAIVQQWVKKQKARNPNFFFLDCRIAYMEAPDMIGFPKEVQRDGQMLDGIMVNGKWITVHCIPEIWPDADVTPDLEGLILFEEPNRGTTGVMNCLMQVLTDRQIHKLKLPEKVIIAACVNPDGKEYDVNSMDAALRDRFEEFVVEYDHMTFVDHMHDREWDENIINFFGTSGIWIYKPTDEIGEEARYISPRTISKGNAAEKAGARKDRWVHRTVMTSIFGRDIGNEYHKFCFDQAPVTAADLLSDKKKAFKRLEDQSDKNNYKGDMIAMTVESVVKHYGGKNPKDGEVSEDLMCEVAKIIPGDQAVVMIKGCGFKDSKGQINTFFKQFVKDHPDLVGIIRDAIVIERGLKKT